MLVLDMPTYSSIFVELHY